MQKQIARLQIPMHDAPIRMQLLHSRYKVRGEHLEIRVREHLEIRVREHLEIRLREQLEIRVRKHPNSRNAALLALHGLLVLLKGLNKKTRKRCIEEMACSLECNQKRK